MAPPKKRRLEPLERMVRVAERWSPGAFIGRSETILPSHRVPDPRITQVIPPAVGGGPWPATFVVAASDSQHPEAADFVCDGTADQVEINDALALLPQRGGRVLLLEGTFTVTDSIEIMHDHTTLQGQGHGGDSITDGATRILLDPSVTTGFPIITDGFYGQGTDPLNPNGTYNGKTFTRASGGTGGTHFSGVVIRDLMINGSAYDIDRDSGNRFHHGIFIYSQAWQCKIHNVSVDSTSGIGIVLGSYDFCEIIDCQTTYTFSHGIYMFGEQFLIRGNVIYAAGTDAGEDNFYGEPFASGIYANGDWALINDNHVANTYGSGIDISSFVNNFVVANNQVTRCPDNSGLGVTTYEFYAGINCSNDINSSGLAYGCQIIGNNVNEGNGCGIRVHYDKSTGNVAHNFIIADNFVGFCRNHGIWLFGVWSSLVVGNDIVDCGTSAAFDGINCDGTSGRPTKRCSVQCNMVRAVNLVTGSLATRYGISLEANTLDNWIVNNDLRDSAASASYNDAGTGNDNTTTGNLT